MYFCRHTFIAINPICTASHSTELASTQELQLHLGVLQQHAALIGGPNATSCPVCHKLFLGTEALMDHMKHVHKEKTSPPIEPRKNSEFFLPLPLAFPLPLSH